MQRRVRVDECERGVVVIKGVVGPAGREVAGIACRPVASLVLVIDLVAGDATTGKIVFEILLRVAILAVEAAVTAHQGNL